MSAVLGNFSPSSKCSSIPSSFINPLPSPPPEMANPEEKTTTTTTTPAEEEHKDKNKNNGDETDDEKLSRKFSSAASICSNDNEEHGEGEEDETSADEEEEAKLRAERELELGPQFTLKEQLEKDKDDESLRRWKEQLLGSVDFASVGETLEPEVQILSLTILTPDRPELVLPIPFEPNAKGYAFSLKDGSRYRLKFSFVVSNNIVSGLKYTNTVWKTGVRVENTKVMLGTFSPQQEPYTYELEEETTPSGIFARGSYSAKTKFVDDDGKCYLDISYCFEIRKDWPSPS